MSFSFGSATTTAGTTFGTTTPSTGFAFGSGDASKPFGATDNKPAFNFTSPTSNAPAFGGGGGFAFGAKTTAATSSLFATPSATSAGSAFGSNKPVSFGSPPPNQTVGSPGFGQQQGAPTQQVQPFSMTPQQPTSAFGAAATSTQASTFGTPASSGFSFGKPAATTAAGFGFSTPASGFSAPIASTVTSSAPQTSQSAFGGTPTFGQSTFGSKPSTSFGGTPASAATAKTFAQQPAASVAQPTTNMNFGGAMNFGGSQPAAANTSMGFGTSVSTGVAATTQSSFSFAPTASSQSQGLSFGTVPQTQPATGLNFSTTPATTQGLSFGTSSAPTQPSAGINFGNAAASTANRPATSLSGGPVSSAPTTGLSFGTPASTAGKPSLNFGAALAATAPQPSLNFGSAPASTAPTSTGLGFGTTTASASQPTSGLSFGTTSTATTSLGFGTTATATQPTTGLSFGATTSAATKPATGIGFGTSTGSLSFGTKTSGASTTAASSTAPSGITALAKSTATTTMPSLTTTTTTTAAAPPQPITSITFAELEENINKWTLELEEQEKTFINQATQINAWDRLLIANGEKIIELNDAVKNVKDEQQSLEHELEFVSAQQKELEDILAPMEKQLLENTNDRLRDPEREHMYSLAENLDTQLKHMSEDLKEVIEHLNETNRAQDSNDPIVQIGRILNTHMSSMQWIDNSIAQISNKLDQLKATHDTLRRDNERSFQLTYN